MPAESTEVALNNAIVLLTRAAYAAHERRAINAQALQKFEDLSNEWGVFWASPERAMLPTLALQGTLRGFSERYRRLSLLLPAPERSTAPSPTSIDPSLAKGARDLADAYATGVETTTNAVRPTLNLFAIGAGIALIWFVWKDIKENL